MACRFSAGITILSFFFSPYIYVSYMADSNLIQREEAPVATMQALSVLITACAVYSVVVVRFCHKIYDYSTR